MLLITGVRLPGCHVHILATLSSTGLALELYIEQDDYLGELTEIAGVVVNIHGVGMMPFPENEGYLVSPDKATYFGISLVSGQ